MSAAPPEGNSVRRQEIRFNRARWFVYASDMPLPFLFALAIAQDQIDFTKEFEVYESQRLARTPLIDGQMEPEEWDDLAQVSIDATHSAKTFFQWEPGKLHAAAVVPDGHDLVFSMDLRNDGWLIGSDNLEVRLTNVAGAARVTARLLDGTRAAGPTWVDLPGFSMAANAAARRQGGLTTYEMSISDPGMGLLPTEAGRTVSVRIDAVPFQLTAIELFRPRTGSPVTLVMQRSAAMPAGLRWNTEGAGRSVAAGEWMRLRQTFNGNSDMGLARLVLRSEGLVKDRTNKIEAPFPRFDERGRAFIDYDTNIMDDAPVGYHVLHGTLYTQDGIGSIMQSSYRIAPPVDFEIVRQQQATQAADRSVRYAVYLRSNTGRAITGDFNVEAGSPLRLLGAPKRDVRLAGRQNTRYTFDVVVPANFGGTVPIRFRGRLNNQPIDQTAFITIGR
jgi:hypothetical protein